MHRTGQREASQDLEARARPEMGLAHRPPGVLVCVPSLPPGSVGRGPADQQPMVHARLAVRWGCCPPRPWRAGAVSERRRLLPYGAGPGVLTATGPSFCAACSHGRSFGLAPPARCFAAPRGRLCAGSFGPYFWAGARCGGGRCAFSCCPDGAGGARAFCELYDASTAGTLAELLERHAGLAARDWAKHRPPRARRLLATRRRLNATDAKA